VPHRQRHKHLGDEGPAELLVCSGPDRRRTFLTFTG